MHIADLEEKEALLAAEPVKLITTPHGDGYASALVVLAKRTKAELRKLVTDSWHLRAPKLAGAPLGRLRAHAPASTGAMYEPWTFP